MKFKEKTLSLKNKLWFNVFVQIALIFAVFVAVLMLCNSTLLSKFFCMRQKDELLDQIDKVSKININDTATVSETLTDISENYNFDVEIYDAYGKIKYTTHGSQMMDFFIEGHTGFNMMHEDLLVTKSKIYSDGTVYEEATKRFSGDEYMLCRKRIDTNYYAEIKVQKQLIVSSAKAANEFITVIAVLCLLGSIVWVVIFAKRFSKPITEMNIITRDMANLNFDRKINVTRTDEIGQLAMSVNEMSNSLSATLENLKSTNAKLVDEIELERQLDKMRKTFVANVSHELKTPISIISGYAEGLKLNINAESREKYCNTIIDESCRMNQLVLSILELSKYESGQLTAQKTDFDIADMSNTLVERIFDKTDITAVSTVKSDTKVFADQMLIEQSLTAYLENAKSHVNQGGTVTVFAEDNGDKLRVCVNNTGSHVPPEKMPYIWQSFYRGDNSHKRDNTRFGLGLSIVQAVMNMHGSSCGVYNTENGVTFWIEIDKS